MLAFIWDLDGTLLDSYGVIVDSLYQIYLEKGAKIDKKEIFHDVINESVSYFIMKMEKRFGIPFDDLKDRYSIISHNAKGNIKAMKNAKEILKFIIDNNIPNYVFTHRGVTTESILKDLGIYE
ncbi:MAG: HAD hydrolase-like protein, partial [Bacilli bacterium]|nr:HAD hydrolase-like protein [Bacilli bacterium]